jgi:hypothetical protein
MSLDTEIKGSPGSVESASSWLRGSLAPAVASGADALVSARSSADADWGGDAGPAFSAQMRSGATVTDELSTRVRAAAGDLDAYASALRRAQNSMADIRSAASGAGLTVSGFVIANPGPGPAAPGPPSGESITVQQVDAYDGAVAAYNQHQKLIQAWNTAVADVAEVNSTYEAACRALENSYKGQSPGEMVVGASDVAGALAASRATYLHVSILRQTATTFSTEAAEAFRRINGTDYTRTGHSAFYDDIRNAERLQGLSDDATRAADDAVRGGSKFTRLSGGLSKLLVGVGIGMDLHDGESVPQAVASNVGGYAAGAGVGALASVGTSMAMGAAFGSVVPGVGTAVGAVVGLGVGIFASGAIDSLFENGPDVGQAISEGAEAVTDTVDAVGEGIGDAAEGVGDFVGGLF